ncbi:hypothetical protein KFE94_08805 [bacterium SCSIO 12643]|nr:hypothetical protein KFE94_08805 [bacterium SCSIO 12643]
MIRIIKLLGVVLFLGALLIPSTGCQPPPTITVDPDLTGNIVGPYDGNYVVNYATHPQDNFSSQINLVVSRIDKKLIRVDAQGGDSFECSISGTSNNLTLSNIHNAKGLYTLADDIEGVYINGRLYYKVTGTSNGGAFYAEFTVL